MAKKPSATARAASGPSGAIDPDTIYFVELKRAVKLGRMVLRPRDSVRLKGKVIERIRDDVVHYTPVE